MRALLLAVMAFVISATLLPTRGLAQANPSISGRVVSRADNTALPGATVLQKGTTNGTATNSEGSFSLEAPLGSTLVISSVGFVTVEITATAAPLRVVMATDTRQLSDVVVVGYGSVKRSDLTGSVASIKSAELLVGTPLSLDRGLQGKVAGLQVTQNDGAPGAGISMQIRGVNSFGSNTQPLYVIDGVPLEVNNNASTASGDLNSSDKAVLSTNALNFLRPADIESIEVLKDASATAIYGSRGSNGVVMVTTRRGQSGNDHVDVNFRTGFDQVARKIKMLDAATYASYLNEKYYNDDKYLGTMKTDTAGGDFQLPFSGLRDRTTGIRSPLPADFVGRNTDWQNVIFQRAPINEATVTFSGGTADKGNFSISANYIRQAGIITSSSYEQGGLRLNVSRNIKKWLTFETNSQITRSLNKLVKTGTSFAGGDAGAIYAALRFGPTNTVTGQQLIGGGLYITPSDQIPTTNPKAYVEDVKNQNLVNSIFSSNSLIFNILPGLQARTRLGLNYYTSNRNVYYPRSTFEGRGTQGALSVSTFAQFELTSENLVSYTRKFADKHELTAVAGYTFTDNNYSNSGIQATRFLNDALQDNNVGAATNKDIYSGRGENVLLSYLGRLNYTFNSKYLFTLTGRLDGSSKFAANNKYAPFAAGAFAWRAVDERFISDLDVFSDLKVRLSYGTSGNQGIGSYESLARLNATNYVFGGALVPGFFVGSLASPNLTWETTYQADAGIDVGLFKGRLNLTVDVYDKQTKNLLQNLGVPPDVGFNTVRINAGQVQNRGLEMTLSGRAVDNANFKWTPSANISINRNQIVALGAGKTVDFSPNISYDVQPFILEPGQAIGRIYALQEDGIYKNIAEVKAAFPKSAPLSDEEALKLVGKVRYKDVDGDGLFSPTLDRTVVGNVNPKFVWGFNNSLNYKGLDLGVFFQGSYGNDIINNVRRTLDNLGTTDHSNISQAAYDSRWTAANPNGTTPRAGNDDTVPLLFSNRFVEDGTYVRLKNVSLGYNFTLTQYGLRAARLYASITNLYTWTRYTGYDPEVNAYGQDPARRGVDLGNYPTARSFSLGVNVGF